jgi:hypothetical protein
MIYIKLTWLLLYFYSEIFGNCVMSGQYGSRGVLGREMLSESKLRDLLHGSEYILTYDNKKMQTGCLQGMYR